MNEQWRRQLRDKMEGYGEQPPRIDWAEMERFVAGHTTHGTRRGMAVVWGRRIAVAAAVAALIVTATMRLSVTDRETAPAMPKAQQPLAMDDGLRNKDTRNDAVRRVTASADMPSPTTSTRSETSAPAAPEQTATQAIEPPVAQESAPPSPATRPTTTTAEQPLPPQPGTQLAEEPRATRRHRHVTLGAYLANAASSQATTGSHVMMLAAAEPIGAYDNFMSSEATNGMLRTSPPAETTVRHSRPLRVGLSLRYGLGLRWSIETGITYTYLHSETTWHSGHNTQTADQRLHYVGVPIGLSYSLLNTRRINIYATANVMAEKCVTGTVTVSRPQFSTGAAIGAEVSLGNGLGIYIEPGLTHHFDNHSTVTTIYKDRPTDFSLKAGLRMNLK